MRFALRLPWPNDNPNGVLGPATDFLIRHGERVTIDILQNLIGGNATQLEAYLTGRARGKRDVPLPQRRMRGEWALEDVRAAVPMEVRELFNTALDPNRGGAPDQVRPGSMGRVALNEHDQLQVVGTVVAFHGPRFAALKRMGVKAERSVANLALPLAGVDICNPARLAHAFTAMRHTLKLVGDRIAVHRTLRDIWHWRHVVDIFEDYVRQPGLPAELLAFLEANRPVWPSGGDTLFKGVAEALDDFKADSKAELEKDLQPFLKNAPGFICHVLDTQAQIEAFHDRVMAKVAAAELAESGGAWPLCDTFETRARLADGELAVVSYEYEVHPWSLIMERINAVTTAFTRDKRNGAYGDCFNLHPGDDQLFENKYAVSMLRCTRDGVKIEYPLDIVRLHRDFGFWRARDLPDAAAYGLRSVRLRELGLNESMLEETGGEIANFGKSKFLRARKARQLLGMFLLPLVETHHSALVGALHVAARSVEALRIGDLEQWNVGSGLSTGYDADGEAFSILSSTSKRKTTERHSPLTAECDALADKLLALECQRFFQGGPIPELPRARYNGRGPKTEQMLFCGRKAGMCGSTINANSRLLMGGSGGFKSHYSKYVWAKLSRLAGESLTQRKEGHGHATERMAAYHDVLTPDEKAEMVRILHEQARVRAMWIRGERTSPLPDPLAGDMTFERRRLANEIAFLESEDAQPRLIRARAHLLVLDAKIARAGLAI